MNKQATITGFGTPSAVFAVTQSPRPTPVGTQVLVHLLLRPVNPSDVSSIEGVYAGFRPRAFPAVPGFEGVGVVAALGPGATKVVVGQRVVPLLQAASWQEFVIVDEAMLVAVPEGVSDAAAAQAVVNPVTVVGMLDTLAVPRGEFVIQDAAGSALGRMAIKVARHRGIKTINLVRREDQANEIRDLGGDVVVVTHGLATPEAICHAILKATGGKRPYGGTSCVGGISTAAITLALRAGGTVLIYGALGGNSAEVFSAALIFRDIRVRGYWLTREFARMSQQEKVAAVQHVLQLMSEGVIVADHVGHIYSLDRVVEAVAKSVEPGRGGKVLLANL
ncbi:hypothetical protein HDU98_000179 [Podochytrium sp. JEL0797]|nr:hypothetical protein HDU98_000179 [Podochytrium sp. JEL0797]